MPRPAVPFVASLPGEVPASGAPTIAGIQLPAGIACPGDGPPVYWRTLEPIDDPRRLTSPLGGAFAQTGLWPLLYAWEEDPENYWFGGPGAPDNLAVDIDEVMRVQWESWKQSTWGPRPIFPEFPGLAEAQGASEAGCERRSLRADQRRHPASVLGAHAVAPARALPPTGGRPRRGGLGLQPRALSDHDRAAAVMGPAFRRRPGADRPFHNHPQRRAATQTHTQAQRLVAEFAAVCEFDVGADDDWLERTASLLLHGSPIGPTFDTVSPTHWRIAFQEQPSEALAELADR